MSLKNQLTQILQNFALGECLLLSDESFYTRIYSNLLTDCKIPFQEVSLLDLESLLAGQRKIDKYLILPKLSFRIFNINYDRQNQIPLAMHPYWVHRRSTKGFLITQTLQKFFKDVLSNPLENHEDLLRTYFSEPRVTDWLTGPTPQERHNDFFERMLWQEFFPNLTSDIYQAHPRLKAQSLEDYLFKILKLSGDDSTLHFPLHSLMAHLRLPPLPINQLEQEIYGFEN